MKEPKVKPNAPPPKMMERSIRTSKKVKIRLNKSIDNIYKINNTNKAMQKHMPDNQHYDNAENYATDNVTEKGEYITRKISNKVSEKIKKATKDSAGKASNIRQAQSGKTNLKSAIHTGKKTNKLVKTPIKGVKTTKKSVKAAVKTSKRTAKVANKAAIAAKKAAVTAVKTTKLAVKAIAATVKATIAAIKGLVAAIAAGGWVVVVIIIVVALIITIMASPLAIFSNETNGTTPTISEVVKRINGEYSNTITSIITKAGEVDEVIIEGEASSSKFHPGNWIDVIGVFSVKSTITSNNEEFIPVVYMEDKQIKKLEEVFWGMNIISHDIIEEIIEPEPTPTPTQSPTPDPSTTSTSPTPEPTPEIYRTLIVSIESKTYEEGIEMYNMSNEQIEVLEELMSSDYFPMFMEICGMDSYIGLTSEQMINLINDLPTGELGSVIVEYALSRLGDPYSQTKRGQGDYVDCSYLARWCYQQAGALSFTAGTAAEQARYCVNKNLSIAYSSLQPGDLIFWSFNANGRFLNITHVGIYTGNGYVIDASSSRGMVVYRPIFGISSIVVCGRPHVK